MASKEKTRLVLVMCSPDGWQWGLNLELINSKNDLETIFKVIDLSFNGIFSPYLIFKSKIGGFKFRKSAISYLKKNSIKYQTPRLFPLNFNLLKIKKNYHLNFDLNDDYPTFNSIVSKYKSLDFKKIKKSIIGKTLIIKETLICLDTIRSIEKSDITSDDTVVVVNGRFTKNATVIFWCKKKGINYKVLEFGSLLRNTFELFDISPHSVNEIQAKIDFYWGKANHVERRNIAAKYIQEIINRKSSSPIDFRKNITDGFVPKIIDKKICVFFASSEFEYAGIGDPISSIEFKSQVEALNILLSNLDPAKWHLYIRRHPVDGNSHQKDYEEYIWREFKRNNMVTVFEPNSTVDSLALGNAADLIASYWSTINLEFIMRGKRNVITMGQAPWNHLIPENHVSTESQLINFLKSELPKYDVDRIFPWAFYQSSHGIDFKIVETDTNTGKWKLK